MAEFWNQSTLKFAALKPINTQFVEGGQAFLPTPFIDFGANGFIIFCPSIIHMKVFI
jgi:hypothetical protein